MSGLKSGARPTHHRPLSRKSISLPVAKTYGYDSLDRLTSVDATTYAYNGLGQRVSKTASGSGTVYAYDEAGHLVGEYDAATGNAIQETVWMGDTPIAVVKGSDTYYVHADHLNTPRQINNQAGDPVWVWDTITFGSSSPDEDPLSTGTPFTYNLRHPGQVFDAESGLFQNWHRDYNPALGRYVQSDPIGLAGGINTYLYGEANPLSYIDPLGLETVAAPRVFPMPGFPAIARLPWILPHPVTIGLMCLLYPTPIDAPACERPDSLNYGNCSMMNEASNDGDKPSASDVQKDKKRRFDKGQRERARDRSRDADGDPTCVYCGVKTTTEPGKPNSSQTDHVLPWSLGGPTSDDNAANSCQGCNGSKGAKELGKDWIPPNLR